MKEGGPFQEVGAHETALLVCAVAPSAGAAIEAAAAFYHPLEGRDDLLVVRVATAFLVAVGDLPPYQQEAVYRHVGAHQETEVLVAVMAHEEETVAHLGAVACAAHEEGDQVDHGEPSCLYDRQTAPGEVVDLVDPVGNGGGQSAPAAVERLRLASRNLPVAAAVLLTVDEVDEKGGAVDLSARGIPHSVASSVPMGAFSAPPPMVWEAPPHPLPSTHPLPSLVPRPPLFPGEVAPPWLPCVDPSVWDLWSSPSNLEEVVEEPLPACGRRTD